MGLGLEVFRVRKGLPRSTDAAGCFANEIAHLSDFDRLLRQCAFRLLERNQSCILRMKDALEGHTDGCDLGLLPTGASKAYGIDADVLGAVALHNCKRDDILCNHGTSGNE
jgi:hypothetical protein